MDVTTLGLRRLVGRVFWFCLTFVASIETPACAEAAADALPVTTFRNLQAGKKQTVIVYGTSLTAIGEWSNAVGDYFAKEFPGQVTFSNAAKSGMQSNWGASNLAERVLSRNPDLVFIEFAINDANTKNKVPLEKSEANLDEMVQALRRQNPRVDIVLQTMNLAWDSPKVPEKKYGSDRPNLEAYYEIYRRSAREHDLPLVDNLPAWSKLLQEDPEKYRAFVPDGIHPNSEASLSITWPAVRTLLERARAAAAEPVTNQPSKGDKVQRSTNVSHRR